MLQRRRPASAPRRWQRMTRPLGHDLERLNRYPGRYLFHAHKTEFAELGWPRLVQVVES